jgi:hypothetical protein
MKRRTYYASAMAGDENLVKLAVRQLAINASQDGASQAWLVGNSKDDLKNGIVANALGKIADELRKGRAVNLAPGCELQFFSARTLPHTGSGTPVLACWPTRDLLDKLDAIPGISTLIVLPWNWNDIKSWLYANGAEDILGQATVSKAKVTSPTVLRALESIRSSININTGLSHPSDRDRVIEAFEILRDAGEPIDADEVRAWLQQAGMKPQYAEEASEIATDPGKFRKSSPSQWWPAEILDRWRGTPP